MSNTGTNLEGSYRIGAGRTRPQYTPKSLLCPNCSAPLLIQAEETAMIRCHACDSILELSDTEAQVLGTANKQKRYPLLIFPLQTAFQFDGQTYRIIARMVYRDGWGDLTYEYLLFNPFFGSFYLSCYDKEWSVSHTTRTILPEDPFVQSKKSTITTFQGESWNYEERSEMSLRYVDGALPWLAQIGDTHQYVAFVSQKNEHLYLEVEKETSETGSGDEIEYLSTQILTAEQIRVAIIDESLRNRLFPPPPPPPSKTPFFLSLVVCIFAIGASIFLSESPNKLRTTLFDSNELVEDSITPSFEITTTKYPVEICLESTISNAWMIAQWAIVKTDTPIIEKMPYAQFIAERKLDTEEGTENETNALVHIADDELSYYFGGSGDDSWSEGSTTNCHYILFQELGHYSIVAKAVSNVDETETAETPMHNLYFSVSENVQMSRYYNAIFWFGIVFAMRSFVGLIRRK